MSITETPVALKEKHVLANNDGRGYSDPCVCCAREQPCFGVEKVKRSSRGNRVTGN